MDMVSKYRQSGKEMKPFRSDFSFFQTASTPSLPCFVSLYHEKCVEVNIFLSMTPELVIPRLGVK
jgi:hypothetical protein